MRSIVREDIERRNRAVFGHKVGSSGEIFLDHRFKAAETCRKNPRCIFFCESKKFFRRHIPGSRYSVRDDRADLGFTFRLDDQGEDHREIQERDPGNRF